MITNNLYLKTLGSEEGVLAGSITQNNIPVLEENYVARMNANNGFSEKRMFRKILSIPDVDYLNAAQEGYNFDDEKEIYRYFKEHPGHRTVDNLLTPRDPHIIMK